MDEELEVKMTVIGDAELSKSKVSLMIGEAVHKTSLEIVKINIKSEAEIYSNDNPIVAPTSEDPKSWVDCVWEAVDKDGLCEDEWNDLCTAMAWISEELGVENEGI